MDFYSLKRRDLQALCKKNNIPANLTNAAMADALNSLEIVEGVEEFLVELENGGSESPVRSVLTSPNVPQSMTRQKPSKQGQECSKLATRTRGTRRAAAEGTDARKTPATRTTRRKAKQESSSQQKTQIDLQAEFEENLEQSEGIESIAISEEVSGLSVDKPEVSIDGEEIVDVDDNTENMENDCIVSEDLVEEPSEMPNNRQTVDFHSLGRKDLQNLCKKNKIPANTTNAAMADALESLETIEGLDEFLKGYDPLAIKSPETSRMTATRTRQGRTDRKTTARKSARVGSAVCKSLAKKIEDLNVEDEGGCPASVAAEEVEEPVDKNLQGDLEACLKKPEFEEHVSENCNTIDGELISVSEEVSSNFDSSVGAVETVKELPDEAEICDNTGESESNLNMDLDADLQENVSENLDDNQQVKVDKSEESDTDEITKVDTECLDNPNVDNGLMHETAESETDTLDEYIEFNDKRVITESLESDTVSTDDFSSEDLMIKEVPALGTEGFGLSPGLVEVANREGSEALLSTDNSKQLGDLVNEDASTEEDSGIEDISIPVKDDEKPIPEEGLDVAEDDNIVKNVETDPEPYQVSDAGEQEVTSSEEQAVIEDNEYENCKEQEVSNAEEQEVISSEEQEVISLDNEYVNCEEQEVSNAEEQEVVISSEKQEVISLDNEYQAEKLGSDSTEDQLSKKFVPDPAAEASPAPKAETTPLPRKSLRQLKKMLKDTLQLKEANLLAKKMEKLVLDEDMGEGAQEAEESKGLNLTKISGSDAVASAPISADNATEDGIGEESNVAQENDVLASENSEYSITDQITAHESVNHDNSNLKLEKPFDESTSPEQVCKTPISTGRTKCFVDANKENIDSARKTEAGKINMVVVSPPMSMVKLKKEVKGLLQQSEKKRKALQSRSDNQFPMSPQNI